MAKQKARETRELLIENKNKRDWSETENGQVPRPRASSNTVPQLTTDSEMTPPMKLPEADIVSREHMELGLIAEEDETSTGV